MFEVSAVGGEIAREEGGETRWEVLLIVFRVFFLFIVLFLDIMTVVSV